MDSVSLIKVRRYGLFAGKLWLKGATLQSGFFLLFSDLKKAPNASPPEKIYGVRMLNLCIATSFLTKLKS